MITRAAIVTEARRWLGTPWKHQASLRGVGTDCIGLVAGVARELGMDAAEAFERAREYHGYGREPDPRLIALGCASFLDPADAPARAGDVLVLRFRTEPQHFALVTERGIIHAYAQARRVVEHRIDPMWAARVVSAWSFRGIG